MKSIYIVSTYYHALIACSKILTLPCANTDIAVTAYIPDYENLAKRISDSHIFRKVFTVGAITEYHPKNKFDLLFNLHRKNAKLIESQIRFSLKEYNSIYIFHDDIWAAHYCKNIHHDYHIIEDALDSFKNIKKSPFSYMIRNDMRYKIKKLFRIGYVFYGDEKLIKTIEVNNKQDIEIFEHIDSRIVEAPREELFSKLSSNDRNTLREIFLKDIPKLDYSKCVLLLTQPLYTDFMVSTEEVQIKIFLEIAKKYCGENEQLVIKPHPRDNAEYARVFPDAVIIRKNMPVEILSICQSVKFKRVVSIFSTANQFVNAEERILCKL